MTRAEIRTRLEAAIAAGRHFQVGARVARAIPAKATREDSCLAAALLLVDAAHKNEGDRAAFLADLSAAVHDIAADLLRKIEKAAA